MQCLKKFIYVVQNKSRYYNRINPIFRKRECAVLKFVHRFQHDSNVELEGYGEDEEEKDIYKNMSQEYLGIASGGHKVFIIQPYIKWGRDKKTNTTPTLQLEEAVALIKTLPNWSIAETRLVPLLSLKKKQLVGSGTLETLKRDIHRVNATAMFVSTNLLKFVQMAELQAAFWVPVYDRYSIVIHIFREHAKTPEAKLQVALAEIPYIKKKMMELTTNHGGRINITERCKLMLERREKRIRNTLQKLREHRKLIKNQREKYGFPSIAVVGYTNAGKTCLIKALTGDASMQPENKLFATLDTTVHQGFLFNTLKVLYVDTIGFIQDVPDTLIEPFKVTLEDAINADIIIHVFDISHPDVKAQVQHIQETIKPMIGENKLVINVANKCDVIGKDTNERVEIPEDTFVVSATALTGIDLLRLKIEKEIISAANLISKRVRLEAGSNIVSWFYKEATVTSVETDPENPQYLVMDVIMSHGAFHRLKKLSKQ
ncbi:putative GTP-binding protein 6 [Hylaeus anthracinus]|uniref:putative GTP-binding protein 6 n=1 Tax=Hylaeus anthracinus TaxID=313031 RepID=UPI0023B9B25D|nr:putative GTP-binding protein 6 [Hylaeus anthracinus]